MFGFQRGTCQYKALKKHIMEQEKGEMTLYYREMREAECKVLPLVLKDCKRKGYIGEKVVNEGDRVTIEII